MIKTYMYLMHSLTHLIEMNADPDNPKFGLLDNDIADMEETINFLRNHINTPTPCYMQYSPNCEACTNMTTEANWIDEVDYPHYRKFCNIGFWSQEN